MSLSRVLAIPALALLAIAAGCGGGAKTSAPATTAAAASSTTTTAAATTTSSSSSSGALTAEVQATAAGDIPDNQVFLTFHDGAAGYSLKYPEGWVQNGSGSNVSFSDKNNRIRVVVSAGPALSLASVQRDIAALKTKTPSFSASTPSPVVLPAGPAFKVTYSTVSAPDPVTNKKVTLVVDRYYLSRSGKRATIDLGAPKGVDNVDAYRLISQSFRWR